MKIEILAPHQTIDGHKVEIGDKVDTTANQARRLIDAGYARSAPADDQQQPAEPDPEQAKPATTKQTTRKDTSK